MLSDLNFSLTEFSPPDLRWMEPLLEDISNIENTYFLSFQQFLQFPIYDIENSLVTILNNEWNDIAEKAREIIKNINKLSFEDPKCFSAFLTLSKGLEIEPTIALEMTEEKVNIPIKAWIIGQIPSTKLPFAFRLWREHIFIQSYVKERIPCHAALLLLDSLVTKCQQTKVPPFRSDEFELVFALAYCSSRSPAPKLASFVLPHLVPLIAPSISANLLFRRILPYCAMENKKGQKVALSILEEIITNHDRFPSCVSTWISLHRMYF